MCNNYIIIQGGNDVEDELPCGQRDGAGAKKIKLDTSGVPITEGYSGGFGFTQALGNLPMGISVSRIKIDEVSDVVEETAGKMLELGMANDSGE